MLGIDQIQLHHSVQQFCKQIMQEGHSWFKSSGHVYKAHNSKQSIFRHMILVKELNSELAQGPNHWSSQQHMHMPYKMIT